MELNNKYFLLRHGEAVSNATNVISSWPETFDNPLTARGVEMIADAAVILQEKNVDVIVASDVLRTQQTAQIVATALGLDVQFDERLREIGFGDMNGRPVAELESKIGRCAFPGYRMFDGEDYLDVLERAFACLQDLEKTYLGKTIVLVSHQSVLCLLEEKVKGLGLLEIINEIPGYLQMEKGEVRELTTETPEIINEAITT